MREVEETTIYDDPDFQAYVALVADILSVERKWPDERPKGWTRGEIHTVLGEKAKHVWTDAALGWIDGVHEDIGTIMRYRLDDAKRIIPQKRDRIVPY